MSYKVTLQKSIDIGRKIRQRSHTIYHMEKLCSNPALSDADALPFEQILGSVLNVLSQKVLETHYYRWVSDTDLEVILGMQNECF